MSLHALHIISDKVQSQDDILTKAGAEQSACNPSATMAKLFRFILLILFIPLIFAFSYEALLFLTQIEWKETLYFWLGFVVYLVLYAYSWHEQMAFLETLEHELTHAAASLSILQMPGKLVVDPKGGGKKAGVVETVDCVWVKLAPYFLPLFTLPLLVVKLVVPPPFDKIVDFLIGFTLAFHYVRLYNDLKVTQTDITETGTIFSFIVSVFLNLFFLLLILVVVTGQLSLIPEYFKVSWERTKAAYQTTWEFIKSVDLSSLQWPPWQ
jgi:hypothetical protein